MAKFTSLCLLFLLCVTSSYGQVVTSKNSLNFLFARNVKSIDELINRFNGTESHPDIAPDSLSRRNNILSLFNPDIDTGELTKDEFKHIVIEFVTDVENWPGRLDIASDNIFVEVPCDFKFADRPFEATLLLRRETTQRGSSRWAIAGVKGLRKAGFYSSRFTGISPVDHEMEFVGFADLFNTNKKLIPNVMSNNRGTDELSLFLGLSQSHDFKFVAVHRLRIHFLDVPGYVFSISQSLKESDMGAWMIDHIDRAGDFNKLEYINQLFGLGQ